MYFIALNLKGKPEQYETLNASIKALGSWSNFFAPGAWIVHSRFSSRRIRDLLKPHLQAGDRMLVCQMGRNWSGTGDAMGSKFGPWLSQRAFDLDEVDGKVTPPQGEQPQ